MDLFLVNLLDGLVMGLLLFMLSSGLTLIFSMMGVLNFAHASFFMLGAYFAYQISTFMGFWAGLIVAPVVVGLIGALVERFGLRRVHQYGHVPELIFTFGLALLIEEIVQFFWGKSQVPYQKPEILDFALFSIANFDIQAYKIFMIFVAMAIFIVLLLILTRTRIGLIIQAALSHPRTVESLGHNVPLVFMGVFGVGTALAGVAGVIAGPQLGTHPGMAILLGSIVFVTIVIGGLGSLWGALVASLLIGWIQTFAATYNVGLADLFMALGMERPEDLSPVGVPRSLDPVAPAGRPDPALPADGARARGAALRPLRKARRMSVETRPRHPVSERGDEVPADTLPRPRPVASPWAQTVPWIVAAAVLAVLPLVFPSASAVTIMNQMAITVVFALSYNMLLGQGGMLSFGHAVYMGLGGFFAVHMLNWIEDGLFPMTAPAAAAVRRPLRHAVRGADRHLLHPAGGRGLRDDLARRGRAGRPRPRSSSSPSSAARKAYPATAPTRPSSGSSSSPRSQVYYLIGAWVLLSALGMWLFSRTPLGRMANAVRDNPERAEFLGYSARWVRYGSFVWAGFFAGVAGALFAINYEILTEENLNLVTSGEILLVTFLGGVGFFIGPVIGAVVFTLLQTVLSLQTEIWQLYVGALFVATVMFFPGGLAGLIAMHETPRRHGKLGSLVVPYFITLLPAIVGALACCALLEMLFHVQRRRPRQHRHLLDHLGHGLVRRPG